MKKVLIIEDSKVIRDELNLLLTRDGYQVIAPDSFYNIIRTKLTFNTSRHQPTSV